MKNITLTEAQIKWIKSSIEHDMMFGSQDPSIDAFRHKLIKALK